MPGQPGSGWPGEVSPLRPMLPRRDLLGLLGATAAAWPRRTLAADPVRFGLTPVFLDSDIELLETLRHHLEGKLGRKVALVKRRTYQEITTLLLSGRLDAAWICGYPYVQYRDRLSLVAVPKYRGAPLYQAYVIVNGQDPADRFEDCRGHIHAFSDPDSNSGFLVTRHLLAALDETPARFFRKVFFTYGHHNVARAVASGLAHSGSIDGYVWDVMAEIQPRLHEKARVIRKSQQLGFPPVACLRSRAGDPDIVALRSALLDMANDPLGQRVLSTLRLDGFDAAPDRLFDAIAAMHRDVGRQA